MKNKTYMVLNNCSNNTVLIEKDKICNIKNHVLNSYFGEKFITLNDFNI